MMRNARVTFFVVVSVLLCTGIAVAGIARQPVSLSRLPLSFIKNDGQKDPAILFYEQGGGHATAFTPTGVSLWLGKPGKTGRQGPHDLVTLTPLNASSFTVEALDPREGKVNYFIGPDPLKWKTDVPTYGAVLYRGVYPGIDIKFYGSNSELEYDIIVAPHGDPSQVRLSYKGIEKLSLTSGGELEIGLKGGSIFQRKPVIYQIAEGKKTEVPGRFVLLDGATYGFEIGAYDRERPLVIDPTLVYSTFLGGSSNDTAYAIAVDSSGNVYVAGSTLSLNFPTLSAFQPTFGGGIIAGDAFVSKLNPAGTALIYSTYLGGSSDDFAFAIAIDSSGNAYVAGQTLSTNFPTSNPIQTLNAGGTDAFIAKITPQGNALVFSTYWGGILNDAAFAIDLDSSNNIYVAGQTLSSNFPTSSNAFQSVNAGGNDAFITKLNSTDSVLTLVYSTYLGGSNGDIANAIVLDSENNVYVAGETFSLNFPTVNPFQAVNGGLTDGFIAKIGPTGATLLYSTYLGGISNDFANSIALDSSNNIYVAGETFSTNFPTLNPFQAVNAGGSDAFITKISPTGAALVYSTYLGGSGNDLAQAIALDSSGNVLVSGGTFSTNFPTVNPSQPTNHGGSDAFLAKLGSSGTTLVYSTYFGGSNNDFAFAMALDSLGNAYVAGQTFSSDFPTLNPVQATYAGGSDAFILKFSGFLGGFTLSVTKPATGKGTGTVTSFPSGINCGPTCSANFIQGTVVVLTATPAAGSTFTGWTGACTGTGTCTVAMTSAQSVAAMFTVIPQTLTVTISDPASGTVTAKGLTCVGNTCTGTYNYGAAVTLTATPNTGSTFTGWTGCDKTTGVTCQLTMKGGRTVDAAFVNTNLCAYGLVPVSKTFPFNAAGVTVRVTATGAPGCSAPEITASDPWITTKLVSFKNNKGAVRITVPKNTAITTRNGTVTIGGTPFPVTQAGTPCTIAISPAGRPATSAAQSDSFSMVTLPGCEWTGVVSSGGEWLSIVSGSAGNDSGPVTYQVQENTTQRQRVGKIIVSLDATPAKKRVFTVTQRR